MTTKVILVKVQYKDQVWYTTKTITMGQTHARSIIQESHGYSHPAPSREDSEGNSLRARD